MAPNNFPIERITSFEALRVADLGCADDLIKLLAQLNHTPELTLDSRNVFFEKVFTDWDSSIMPVEPAPLQHTDYITEVCAGWIIRKANHLDPAGLDAIPRRRSNVYLRMHIDRDDGTASFTYYDEDGESVFTRDVRFPCGKTESTQRAAAMERSDSVTVPHIAQYNWSMVVYWTRKRLLRQMLRRAGCPELALSLANDELPHLLPENYTARDAVSKTIERLQDGLDASQGKASRS